MTYTYTPNARTSNKMRKFDLTVKNYRCFDDTTPLRLTIQDGFISLVGPNNSGKSSCLKLIYEFRNIWSSLTSTKVLAILATKSFIHTFEYIGVFDQDEIYSDSNDRNLQLEIALDKSTIEMDSELSKIIFSCNRKAWSADLFIGSKQTPLPNPDFRGQGDQEIALITSGSKYTINCSKFISLFRDLASSFYIGPFRNAISEGSGTYFDLSIGTQFIDQWNSWKTGPAKRQNLLIEQVTEDIRGIFEFNSLEINASQSLKTLQFIVNRKTYKLKELGAGISQFVIVLGNIAIRKPAYLLMDEPELNLHPSLQLDFLTTIASYTRNSVIYATHSLGLARSSSDLIYSFTRKSGTTFVKPLEKHDNYSEFLGEMSFSSYREMGFDSILCVEGVNDVKTVQQFLRKLKKDHKVVILPLGGDQLATGDREAELADLKRLSDKIFVLVDSERESADDQLPKRRGAFLALCNKLGFSCCVTQYRAIENYFTNDAVKRAIGPDFSSLSPYERLSAGKTPWSKTENWRIARAMDISDIEDTDVGRFLLSI